MGLRFATAPRPPLRGVRLACGCPLPDGDGGTAPADSWDITRSDDQKKMIEHVGDRAFAGRWFLIKACPDDQTGAGGPLGNRFGSMLSASYPIHR